MVKNKKTNEVAIYQAASGEIAFRGDFKRNTIWGTQQQIADVFNIDRSVATRHINKIFKDGEVSRKSNVQKMHFAHSDKPVNLYSLDIILSVGYRANSAQAIRFRKWATSVLKAHALDGYTINKRRIAANYDQFMRSVAAVQSLLPEGDTVTARDSLELIKAFAVSWVSLDAYDKNSLPKSGATRKRVAFTAESLRKALAELKKDLMAAKQASEIFAQERQAGNVAGIVGNIFQSFDRQDLYPTIEEKAAHLLYFMVKNHPFVDGNKRSGAFAFVWFLQKAGVLRGSLTPEALTALTLLVAESDPKDKEKMTGLVILLLERK